MLHLINTLHLAITFKSFYHYVSALDGCRLITYRHSQNQPIINIHRGLYVTEHDHRTC